MKKKDIIQLVKESIKENNSHTTFYGNREQPSTLGSTTAVAPTDEYPFSKRPKRTATGMMESRIDQSKVFDQSEVDRIIGEVREITGILEDTYNKDVEYKEFRFDDGTGGFQFQWDHGGAKWGGRFGLSLNEDGAHKLSALSYYDNSSFGSEDIKPNNPIILDVETWKDLDTSMLAEIWSQLKPMVIKNEAAARKALSREAKAQADYYRGKADTGRIGYGLSSQPRMRNESVNEVRTSTISKKRAGAELKQKLKGKRSDGMGKYDGKIYGLDSDGKRVELKSLNDLNKFKEFELGDSVNEMLDFEKKPGDKIKPDNFKNNPKLQPGKTVTYLGTSRKIEKNDGFILTLDNDETVNLSQFNKRGAVKEAPVTAKTPNPNYRSFGLYNVIDTNNNGEIISQDLSLPKAQELANTKDEYTIAATNKLAEASNNPYYNAIEAKAKEKGMTANDFIKDLLKDFEASETDQMGYQDIAKLAGITDADLEEAKYAGKKAIPDMMKDTDFQTLQGPEKEDAKKDLAMGKSVTLEIEKEDMKDMTKLKNPKKADLNKDGKLSSYEKTRGSAIEKAMDDQGKNEMHINSPDNMGGDNFDDHEGRHAKMQLKKAAEYSIKLARMMDNMTQLPSWVQSKITKASDYISGVFHYLDYEMTNSQDDLMENVNKHKKRDILMEGAMKKFFEMFDMGKTDEEIVQEYAQKGTTVPEAFISKTRKTYEGMKKMKLELEMGEKEYRNSTSKMVNNTEEGMEPSTEEKQLASGLK